MAVAKSHIRFLRMAEMAVSRGWLILRVRDVPEPGFPDVSSRKYGIRTNATRDVK